MKQKAYSEYRSAKKIWLGELPSHWKVKRIKHTTYVKGRIGWQGLKTDEFIDEGPYLVTGTDFVTGRINWDTCYHVSEERYNEDPFIQLRDNDLLITKDGTIGKVAIVKNLPGKASLNSGVFVTRPTTNNYLTEFLYWVLNSNVFTGFIDYFKTGTTISHLYQKVFVEFAFPVPTIDEQRAINSFLDRETNRIDTLISKKERQIELLQERRAALISNAVTKGLDRCVKMKDSGIDWLGEIPLHWEIISLKHLIDVRDGTHDTPKFLDPNDSTYPLITSKDIIDGNIRFDSAKHISKEDYDSINRRSKVSNGDVIMPMIGTIGNPALVQGESNFAIKNIALFRTSIGGLDSRYMKFFLCSKMCITQFDLFSSGGVQGFVGLGTLRNLKVFKMKNNEDKLIADYLDFETEKIDSTIDVIKQSINMLFEYRTALISAAVTGKIDARNAV